MKIGTLVIGAVLGYAFRANQEAKRQAEWLIVDGMDDVAYLPDDLAGPVEAALETGASILQRRVGALMELLVQSGADEFLRFQIPMDDDDAEIIDIDADTIDGGVIDARPSP